MIRILKTDENMFPIFYYEWFPCYSYPSFVDMIYKEYCSYFPYRAKSRNREENDIHFMHF